MTIYTLTFDVQGSYSTQAPVLHVWYGGIKIGATYATLTAESITLQIDTDDDINHSELRFDFVQGGTEPGRTLTISNMRINGSLLDTNEFFGDTISTTSTSITLGSDSFVNYLTGNDIPEVADIKLPIQGTTGSDKLHGTYFAEIINGGAGHDAIYGAGGDDEIYGGDGQDTISGDHGNDFIYGGNDNDRIYGGDGFDYIEGGAGNDRLEGNGGEDTILGGDGNDTIVGGDNDDTLYGGEGDDLILGDNGHDVIDGGNGLNKIYGGNGYDTITGGNDRDIIGGNAGDDYIVGNGGDDHLDGGADNDTIYGGDGNDRLYGNTGHDYVYGGNGDDYIVGNRGVDFLYGDAGNDYMNGGNDNDTMYGGINDDYMGGEAGNDKLYGEDGNDIMSGGIGSDTLEGAAGNDIMYGGGIDAYDLVALQNADPTLIYSNEAQSVYKIITGPATWTDAAAFAATQTLMGVSGTLLAIETQAEQDFIYAELHEAEVYETWLNSSDSNIEGSWSWNSGYAEDFTFFNSGAASLYLYSNMEAGQHTTASQDYLMMDFFGNWQDADGSFTTSYVIEWTYADLVRDTGADNMNGGSGNNTMFGSDGNNYIETGTGRDLIYGYDGNDFLNGDRGDDIIFGGNGDDTIWGWSNDDILHGGAGQDFIYGHGGNDTIYFGEGADYLYGMNGYDTFIAYETVTQNNDMAYIFDFGTGDKLNISDLLSGYNSTTDDITDFVNIAQGSNTTIQVDRDGTGSAFGWDNIVRLQGNNSISTDVDQLISEGKIII